MEYRNPYNSDIEHVQLITIKRIIVNTGSEKGRRVKKGLNS